MPHIDWNSVEDKEFELIPEGKYTVKIETVDVKNTQKGDEMWVLKMNIEEGNFKNRKLLTNLVFNDGGYGNIKKLYSALFGTKLPANCETTDIIGEIVSVDVNHNEYNGKTYANVVYASFKAVTGDSKKEEEIFA